MIHILGHAKKSRPRLALEELAEVMAWVLEGWLQLGHRCKAVVWLVEVAAHAESSSRPP